jgi:hypothetical protein
VAANRAEFAAAVVMGNRRWIVALAVGIAAIIALSLLVVAALNRSSGTPTTGASDSIGAPADQPSTTHPATAGSAGPVQPTGQPRPTNGPTNAGDANHPGNGNWVVGSAAAGRVIASGTYETTVPAGSTGCEWTRVALNHTIAASGKASAGQHVTVTVAATDALFNTKGCGEWTRVG